MFADQCVSRADGEALVADDLLVVVQVLHGAELVGDLAAGLAVDALAAAAGRRPAEVEARLPAPVGSLDDRAFAGISASKTATSGGCRPTTQRDAGPEQGGQK